MLLDSFVISEPFIWKAYPSDQNLVGEAGNDLSIFTMVSCQHHHLSHLSLFPFVPRWRLPQLVAA